MAASYFLAAFLGIMLSASTIAEDLQCLDAENCRILQNPENCEYQCPYNDFNLVVHLTSNEELKIDCYNDTLNDLPSLNIGSVRKVEFQRCQVPSRGFQDIFEVLGVNSTKKLNSYYSDLNGTLKSEQLEGLSDLRVLSFISSELQYLDEDVFKNTPNLVNLDLRDNKVVLSPNIFQYVPKLHVLDLANNNINYLPKGVFRNLNKLKILHLWVNNLTYLDEDVFEDLTNLSSLELTGNRLTTLPETVFASMKNLTQLNLSKNDLRNISKYTFLENQQLRDVKLNMNSKLVLPNGLFSNFNNLELIAMYDCNLENIPDDIFANSINIKEIDLHSNKLKTLSENIFLGLNRMKKLSLNSNNLSELPENLFASLNGLEELYLQNNKLTSIGGGIFKNLNNLKYLNLERNEISVINDWAFNNLKILTDINLAHNKITFQKTVFGTPLNSCTDLEYIDLSNNLIEEFPQDLLLNKIRIKKLDLSYNKLTYIEVSDLQKVSNDNLETNLSHNQITRINFTVAEWIAQGQEYLDIYSSNQYSSVVDVAGNPIICDCHALDLVRYFNDLMDPRVKTMFYLKTDDLKCSSPSELIEFNVEDVQPRMLTCSMEEMSVYRGCPESCACRWRPWDKSLIFECNHRNLTKLPFLELPEEAFEFHYNQTEVHLEDNSLTSAVKMMDLGYGNVTRLYLSNNFIEEINWVPPRIEVLYLHNNKLKALDNSILETLERSSALEKVTLNNNLWKCDCAASNLTNFLRQFSKQVEADEVKCENGKLLLNLNEKDLCHTHTVARLVIAIVVSCTLLIVAISLALYYRYQQEIKVWLFAHNMMLWWVTEEEVDKDKVYDAFLSFSHRDEDFVIENLLPILEGGPNPFKICIHYRDWVPGEFITEQIVKSVQQSRRTVVVLSSHFLESVWGKMEFRTAHTEAMSEGRARVIVILLDDVNPDADLDDELKAYLKTNTYVKWGDPWFWNKLKYALPHSKRKTQIEQSQINPQKHANIMITLDDKFQLVHNPTTPVSETTPPVITLDPLLLKQHPLNFTPTKNRTTPPAESGLSPLMTVEIKK